MDKIIINPKGVCSRTIEADVEDGIIQEVRFYGGCSGNTQGVSALLKGMKVDEVISRLEGIKCGCKIMKSRERINPATQQPIVCEPTCKPFAKFSQNFRQNIQNQYETNRDG